MNISVHTLVQESCQTPSVPPATSGRAPRCLRRVRSGKRPTLRVPGAAGPPYGNEGGRLWVQQTLAPWWLGVVAMLLLGLCLIGPANAEIDIEVVTSIKPVHSLASAVMDGVGEPHLLMRGAGSPHEFRLRPSDAAMLEEAAVIFLVDERMETALVRPIETLARDARVVELSQAKGLVRRPLREGGAFEDDHHHRHDEAGHHGHEHGEEHGHHEHEHGEEHDHHEHDHDRAAFDLHVWLDPVNAWAMARMIAEVLSEADPANAAAYEQNVQKLRRRLDDLTEEVAAQVDPVRGTPFIVFHDAYRYFEDRFGLPAMGSAVVSEERSPGVRRIRQLREKVRQLGVTCVFSEPHFDQRLVATIVEGTAIRSGTVDPLGVDVDNGPELYVTMMRNLAAAFRDCLAPADGD